MTTPIVSDVHMKVIKILEKINLGVLEEVPFPPFCADLYLQDYHVIIEVDGPQHSKKQDKKRDDYLLQEYNLPTLRIKIKDLEDRTRLIHKIYEFLYEWADDADERYESVKDKVPWV